MILELHVWGPAFSLPSIDPHCLAAIAYLTQAIPRENWVLVANSGPGRWSKRDLPLLWDSTKWIAGYQNIVDRVDKLRGSNQWSLGLDSSTPPENADVIAFSSFVESSGQRLLDLSLYVSSANYTTVTRPAYSHLLSWPDQWFLPSERRAEAKARTEHLNLSSLDSDNINPDPQKAKSASNFIPEYLRNSRQSISEVVKQAHVASRIRLDGIADAFFEPLEQLLGQKPFLLSENSPSSLDCLAFAYLALAQIPVLPEPWLADAMSRYPTLCGYVKELNHRFWGPVDTDGAIPTTWSGDAAGSKLGQKKESRNGIALPWKESRHGGPLAASSALLENILGSLPVLGGYWKKGIIPSSQTGALSEINANTLPRNGIISSSPGPGVLATGTALAALGSFVFYRSRQIG